MRANLELAGQGQENRLHRDREAELGLLHQIRALPWPQVSAGGCARDRTRPAETRTVKTAYVCRLEFTAARQAIKITRWRRDTVTGKAFRRTVYAVTSLTSGHATAQNLARLVCEHWSIEAHHTSVT